MLNEVIRRIRNICVYFVLFQSIGNAKRYFVTFNGSTAIIRSFQKVILVQSGGMAQWIQWQIAEKKGISANLSFPMPASLLAIIC